MTEQARDEGWRRAVERLGAAMNTLMSGDASAIKALYSHRDDVTAFFGWGGYEKGWAEVSRRWDWAAEQFKGGGPVTYEHLTATVAPGLAVTTHLESTRVRPAGAAEPTSRLSRPRSAPWRASHRPDRRSSASRATPRRAASGAICANAEMPLRTSGSR